MTKVINRLAQEGAQWPRDTREAINILAFPRAETWAAFSFFPPEDNYHDFRYKLGWRQRYAAAYCHFNDPNICTIAGDMKVNARPSTGPRNQCHNAAALAARFLIARFAEIKRLD